MCDLQYVIFNSISYFFVTNSHYINAGDFHMHGGVYARSDICAERNIYLVVLRTESRAVGRVLRAAYRFAARYLKFLRAVVAVARRGRWSRKVDGSAWPIDWPLGTWIFLRGPYSVAAIDHSVWAKISAAASVIHTVPVAVFESHNSIRIRVQDIHQIDE